VEGKEKEKKREDLPLIDAQEERGGRESAQWPNGKGEKRIYPVRPRKGVWKKKEKKSIITREEGGVPLHTRIAGQIEKKGRDSHSYKRWKKGKKEKKGPLFPDSTDREIRKRKGGPLKLRGGKRGGKGGGGTKFLNLSRKREKIPRGKKKRKETDFFPIRRRKKKKRSSTISLYAADERRQEKEGKEGANSIPLTKSLDKGKKEGKKKSRVFPLQLRLIRNGKRKIMKGRTLSSYRKGKKKKCARPLLIPGTIREKKPPPPNQKREKA